MHPTARPLAPRGHRSADPLAPREEITDLLLRWRGGEQGALDPLLSATYRQLKTIAHHLLRRERSGHTLITTALVHETYERLVDARSVSFRDRSHFFALAARLMRRVLVDHARGRGCRKRGGDVELVSLEALDDLPASRAAELVALDEALDELARHDALIARIVELRFFGGLDREAIADALGVSSATVTRRWRSGRAWLIRYLGLR